MATQRSASPYCRPIMPCGQMSNAINRNWATAEHGCRIVEASEGDVAAAQCLLHDEAGAVGWAPKKAYPHHIILHLHQHPPLNFLGWHAGEDDQRNPKIAYIYSGETLENMVRVLKCQAIRGRGVQMWRARQGIPTNHTFIKLVFAEPLFPDGVTSPGGTQHGGMGGLLRLLLFEEEPSLKQTQRQVLPHAPLPAAAGESGSASLIETHERLAKHRERDAVTTNAVDPPSPMARPGADDAGFVRGGNLAALAEEVLEEEQRRELLTRYQRMHDEAGAHPHPPPRPPQRSTASPHPDTSPRPGHPDSSPEPVGCEAELAGFGRHPGPIAGAYRGTPSPPDTMRSTSSVRKRLNKDALHSVMDGLQRDVRRLHKIRNPSPLRPPPPSGTGGSQPPSPQQSYINTSEMRSASGGGLMHDGIAHPSAARAGLREHHCVKTYGGEGGANDPVWMSVFRSYDDRLARCENQVQRILAMLEVREQREEQEVRLREAREASASAASSAPTTAPAALAEFPTDEMQELVLKWVRPAMQKWAKVLEKKIVQNLNTKIDQSFERITTATIEKKVNEAMQSMKMLDKSVGETLGQKKPAWAQYVPSQPSAHLHGGGCCRLSCPGMNQSLRADPMSPREPTLREIMLASDDEQPAAPRSSGKHGRRGCAALNPNAPLAGRGEKRSVVETSIEASRIDVAISKPEGHDLSSITAATDARRPLSLDTSLAGVDGASFVTRKSLLR